MSAWSSCRILSGMQLREQPLRALLTTLAIALGVALGVAVYLINASALSDFDHATRALLGTADLTVRAPASGFDEQLFAQLARSPQIEALDPMLDLEATLSNRRQSLQVLGIDVLRARELQPALAAAIGPQITRLFAADAVVLTPRAADELGLQRSDKLTLMVGSNAVTLRVVDVAPTDELRDSLGIMDIASAQWTLGKLHRLNRIDLRLHTGVDRTQFRQQLASILPAGVVVSTPELESTREQRATRAYRLNLDLLASVTLLTGAFLVFSTQTLAVLRRRAAIGLLRTLGVTRTELQQALLGEGLLLGALGAVLGVVLGAIIAALLPHLRGADLGNAQLRSSQAALLLDPRPMLAFLICGIAAAMGGAWVPAREAARRAPALALRAGDAEPALEQLSTTWLGVALIGIGSALALLPARGSLPWSGYGAIGALLLGAVLLLPTLLRAALRAIPPSGRAVLDVSVAQLRGGVGTATVSLAGVVVSFSLMVAMAIMVHSFRDSFELWLVKLLPSDLQLRAAVGSDTASLSAEDQQRIAALPSIARTDFRHVQSIYLDGAAATLIARSIRGQPDAVLPLVRSGPGDLSPSARPAWVSEALADAGHHPGSILELPLGARSMRFQVAGVWRDYQHAGGAVVIDRNDYIEATGDRTATEASIWQRPHANTAATESAIRAQVGAGRTLEILSSAELRERSLIIFDRVFGITYALEAVAVLVGLAGISVAAGSAALARRAQFGMLRHIGMLRRQVLALLACEGVVLSILGAAFGLALGALLSLVLIYVINRRSFHWSIDLTVPWAQLALLSAVLIAAAAVTALWSGRAALSEDAVRAVREDW
jgi:putative ABC transport system permease protein